MRLNSAAKAVVVGGLIAATLDIVYAFIFYGLRGVPAPLILQSIASGLLGPAAYGGGVLTAGLGLLLHFFIAIAAACTFYFASRRWNWLLRNAVVSGMLFGIGIYAFMNFVVVPFSAFPNRQVFVPSVVVAGLLAHMFLVGLPISLCVRAVSARSQPELPSALDQRA
jgi:hypothetical protein